MVWPVPDALQCVWRHQAQDQHLVRGLNPTMLFGHAWCGLGQFGVRRCTNNRVGLVLLGVLRPWRSMSACVLHCGESVRTELWGVPVYVHGCLLCCQGGTRHGGPPGWKTALPKSNALLHCLTQLLLWSPGLLCWPGPAVAAEPEDVLLVLFTALLHKCCSLALGSGRRGKPVLTSGGWLVSTAVTPLSGCLACIVMSTGGQTGLCRRQGGPQGSGKLASRCNNKLLQLGSADLLLAIRCWCGRTRNTHCCDTCNPPFLKASFFNLCVSIASLCGASEAPRITQNKCNTMQPCNKWAHLTGTSSSGGSSKRGYA